MDSLRLEFSFARPIAVGNPKLQQGKLIAVNGNSKIAYQATSGLAGCQSIEQSNLSGKGRIPACSQVGIEFYQLYTDPIFLPKVRGVEGNFYRITPFMVKVGRRDRGDFGIHRDANVPGSAGCIVIADLEHWQKFEIQMKLLLKEGITRLNLYVS